jgi:YebC/PmpR family DNA-binding regulatory protein
MSGHSHAKTIKHDKDIADRKRGAAFTKVIRLITVAVKEGGTSVETNTRLRMAIEAAKNVNMPKSNVEAAIERASGVGDTAILSEFLFEAYGPGNSAVLIEGITDNRNRILSEVKQILSQHGGKLVGEGAIRWMFDRKGVIIIELGNQTPEMQNKENLEMLAIEAGADDIYWFDDSLEVHTPPESTEVVKKALESKGIKVDSFSLAWLAKEDVEADAKAKEQNEILFDLLDDNDSVQEVYSNLKD